MAVLHPAEPLNFEEALVGDQRSFLYNTRVGFSDIAGMPKNVLFLIFKYLSTEQEEMQRPQTGQKDSADFYYIPAMSDNPTLVF